MAYGNAFPASYNFYPQYGANYAPQYAPQNAQNAQQGASNGVGNTLIWVQGEAGAKSYLVAPNTTVTLWDSENQSIYLKSADASGMPSMKILDYKIREVSAPTTPMPTAEPVSVPDYVTHKDLDAFKAEILKMIPTQEAVNE